MNFLTKNLGWILLLIFFIFMLFIISTSNTPVDTGTGNVITSSGEEMNGDETLDELINMLDEEETTQSGSQDNQAEESASGSISEATEEEIEEEDDGFFSFLFGNRNNDDENKDEDVTESETSSGTTQETSSTGSVSENENTQDQDSLGDETQDTQSNADVKVSESDGLMKDSGSNNDLYRDTNAYDEYVANLPGNKIVAELGKAYSVGVNALKLNNKYFNKSLGILYSGDTMVQIGEENSYGCFEVRILNAQNTALQEKTGYVCKKWLQEEDTIDNNVDSVGDETNEEIAEPVTTPIEVTTYIGDQIIISDLFIVVDSVPLEEGDIVDQVSNTDMYTGCFSGLVRETDILPSRGKIITVCYSEIN